jgi:leader peptidase (prepilin peptidase)/N-methyltransferase
VAGGLAGRACSDKEDDVNHWLALAPQLRLAVVGCVGLVLGAIVNWAVSSWAYDPRHASPWSRRHPRDDRTIWLDRLPLVGWWLVRRKAEALGRGFWIRPLCVELGLAAACVGLYHWEVLRGGLLPQPLPAGVLANPVIGFLVHFSYAAHILLLAFMVAASLVDLDEMTIPDAITVPGALVGLAWITAFPWSLLPVEIEPQLVVLMAPFGFQGELVGRNAPNGASLLVGCGCYWLWCAGLLPRPWRTSHGYGRAVQILVARIRRETVSRWIALLAVVGTALIATVWAFDPVRWLGLITALIGLAVGGGIVWVVRNIGTWALGREAMGFGDVTLMAMVGAFVGWQAAVLIFFAAPAAALVLGAVQWLVRRDGVLPYGPFLCLSTVAIVGGWSRVWEAAGPRFAVGWLIPIVLVVGFVLLAVILGLLQSIRSRRGGA